MLETLRAEDFSPLVGTACRLSTEEGHFTTLTVESVEERTRLRRPQDTRCPFSVLLKGPLEPSFVSGLFDLACENGMALQGVGLSRIMPPWGVDEGAAYYQMTFN